MLGQLAFVAAVPEQVWSLPFPDLAKTRDAGNERLHV